MTTGWPGLSPEDFSDTTTHIQFRYSQRYDGVPGSDGDRLDTLGDGGLYVTDQPWDRKDGETSKAYQAFRFYLEMGRDRSIQKVRKKHFPNNGVGKRRWMEKWSSEYDWVARAQAWDDWQDKQRLEARQKAREDAREVFILEAKRLAKELVSLALAESIGEDGVDSAQVRALKEALDRAGIIAKSELDLDVSGDLDHTHRSESIAGILDGFEDKSTSEITREITAALRTSGDPPD